MTSLNALAPSRPGASTRPVSWRNLGWVSWRQYRFSAAGAAVFLGVVAAYLLTWGCGFAAATLRWLRARLP
jgi:hypothetical protein